MRKITWATILVAVFTFISLSMSAQMKPTDEALKNLKPYPDAVDSLERYVIFLEQRTDEALFEVELIPGKTMEVDCNRHRLMGSFSEETVEGWGFTYYVFDTDGRVASTMMMCPQPKEMKFVSGEGMTVRYNSRLPIVAYLPKGYELKYKIWSAGEEQVASKK